MNKIIQMIAFPDRFYREGFERPPEREADMRDLVASRWLVVIMSSLFTTAIVLMGTLGYIAAGMIIGGFAIRGLFQWQVKRLWRKYHGQ